MSNQLNKNLAKKVWGLSFSLKESADVMIEWCVRAREKNILKKEPVRIVHSAIVDGDYELNFLGNIGQLFKYSQKDIPHINEVRNKVLRLLSIALKVHCFYFQEDKVEYEPYFFVTPNLKKELDIGLIYKIEKAKKTIIISEKALTDMNNEILKEDIFIQDWVMIEDSFKWYHLKNWIQIKQNLYYLLSSKQLIKSNTELNYFEMIEKINHLCKLSKSVEELKEIADIVNVSYQQKEKLKPLGIEWSKELKTWYLPKGNDIIAFKDMLEKNN